MRIWKKWTDENYDDPKPIWICCICLKEIEWYEDAVELAWYQWVHKDCLMEEPTDEDREGD